MTPREWSREDIVDVVHTTVRPMFDRYEQNMTAKVDTLGAQVSEALGILRDQKQYKLGHSEAESEYQKQRQKWETRIFTLLGLLTTGVGGLLLKVFHVL